MRLYYRAEPFHLFLELYKMLVDLPHNLCIFDRISILMNPLTTASHIAFITIYTSNVTKATLKYL